MKFAYIKDDPAFSGAMENKSQETWMVLRDGKPFMWDIKTEEQARRYVNKFNDTEEPDGNQRNTAD